MRTQDFRAKRVGEAVFRNSEKQTNVLFVFPHPDDETMASGGLINKLSKSKDFNVHVLSITKGEKGKELLNIPDEELGQIRQAEFENATRILGSQNTALWDFPDGDVASNADMVKTQLANYVLGNNIHTVITYERTGIYGHKDHVALAKIVSELKKEHVEIKVFYSTIPEKYETILNFSKHIKDLELTKTTLCQEPEFRLNIIGNVNRKYRAALSYKSQRLSHAFPLWASLFLLPFEYYTTKYE